MEKRIDACDPTAHGLRNSLTYTHQKADIDRPVICISSYSMRGYDDFETALRNYIEQLKNKGFFENKHQRTDNGLAQGRDERDP